MSVALFFPGLIPTRYDAVAEFVARDQRARRYFAQADEVLGYRLIEAYRDAAIYDWEVYEAGFMAVTLALAEWAEREYGVAPSVCGGQSFGAFMATVRAGVLSYPESLELIRRSVVVERDYFENLAEPLGCHFFYRLPYETVERLLAQARDEEGWLELSVVLDEAVHAVSGSLPALERFERRVREEGGFPFYTMNRAEHCSAVAPLRARLLEEVYGTVPWHEARIPLVSDVDGRLLTDPEEIKHDLLDGWTTPVHWRTVVDGLRAAGTEEVWIPGPRNMFARITNTTFRTRVVSPKLALAGSRDTAVVAP
ncbi:ACP S-malonyltransferase [Streptomyces sp. NRRL WC-3742]|uniref:ACP S-malonyltransferase n=1 Tax=Streptomyces sp. NRRL WC-3742 TaxID=1463934 RepID=UPI000690B59D|nr:ACP S-malonyltransferase [Streptomyces sp. NRRL WC-3742]